MALNKAMCMPKDRSVSRTRHWVLSVCAILCLWGTANAQDMSDKRIELEEDAAIQDRLETLAAAADEENFRRGLDAIEKSAATEPAKWLLQIVWYAARHADERDRAFVGVVLKRVDFANATLVETIAPHLDDVDPAVQGIVRSLLRAQEDRSVTREPDFTAYRAVIEAQVRAGREPQGSLVRFMYESDAAAALRTMVRAMQLRDATEIRAILWAEHVVDDLMWRRRYGFVPRNAVEAPAVRELENLAQHPRWWVRLYVVHVVGAYPELGGEAIVQRLLNDSNELVRKCMMGYVRVEPEPGE